MVGGLRKAHDRSPEACKANELLMGYQTTPPPSTVVFTGVYVDTCQQYGPRSLVYMYHGVPQPDFNMLLVISKVFLIFGFGASYVLG